MKLVLIAEDEYDIALALELVLSDLGYRVLSVADGEAALSAMRMERPDLVILDVMMPVLTGIETLRSMRASPALADIPVILMSAAPLKVSRDELKWVAFLRKPFNLEDMLAAICKAIG